MQHVLMCPACFLGNYLSLPRNHYKQAAMQANAQALQAGAVACGSMGSMSAVCRPAGRSSASSTRVCSRTLSNLHPKVAPTLRPHAHQRMQPATFNPPPRPEPHAINVSNLAPTPQPCHTGVFQSLETGVRQLGFRAVVLALEVLQTARDNSKTPKLGPVIWELLRAPCLEAKPPTTCSRNPVPAACRNTPPIGAAYMLAARMFFLNTWSRWSRRVHRYAG